VRARTDYWPGRVRAAFADAFGESAAVDEGFGPVSVDVPAERWVEALELARDGLDCTFFDFLTAVDELGEGFRVVCHLADHHPRGVEHLVVRTLVPRDAPVLASTVSVFRGARWHERETHEMFGVEFTDPEGEPLVLDKLLLPEGFEGHPLRKEFVLASRVAKPWPGAKEPGESDHQAAAPSRRRTRPPGVPEPEQWGPREPGSEAPDPLAAAVPSGPARRPRRAAGTAPRARGEEPPAQGGEEPPASPEGGGAPNQPRSARRPDPSTVAPPPSSDSGGSASDSGGAPPSSSGAGDGDA
jgi:NADH:ubiquinone oxidoreductase subunit C